ncbi:MAG: hypothetical protein LCH95_19200 [Proteobacteria bacterium]|nr:hypothetical protein [Pseudomonadota bacterium]
MTPSVMPSWTELAIVAGFALVVAVAIRWFQAHRAARRDAPEHPHAALMKRAESLAERSPFLRKVCGEYRANGHISDRQAEAVRKAIARLDAAA